MTLLRPTTCLILIESDGTLGWLGQFPDLATTETARVDWLKSPDRDPDDAAFILTVLAFGRPAMEG